MTTYAAHNRLNRNYLAGSLTQLERLEQWAMTGSASGQKESLLLFKVLDFGFNEPPD